MKSNSIAFVLIVESGYLEGYSKLFLESLRCFGGEHKDSEVWFVKPRDGKPISKNTIDKITSHGACFLRSNINKAEVYLENLNNNMDEEKNERVKGFQNKVYASAFLERVLEGKVDTLVFADSDMLVLNEPQKLHLTKQKKVAVSPSHGKSIGIDVNEELTKYWKKIYDVAGIDTSSLWSTIPPLYENSIYAYFNAGLVACQPKYGIFRKWKKILEEVISDRKFIDSMKEMELFHIDQSSLSAAVLSSLKKDEVKVLPKTYNYPLHRHSQLNTTHKVKKFGSLVFPHYHWVFNEGNWKKNDLEKYMMDNDEYRCWLKSRLPITKKKTLLEKMKKAYGKARSLARSYR